VLTGRGSKIIYLTCQSGADPGRWQWVFCLPPSKDLLCLEKKKEREKRRGKRGEEKERGDTRGS